MNSGLSPPNTNSIRQSRAVVVALVALVVLVAPLAAVGAASVPSDENYDDNGAYTTGSVSSFQLDGVDYALSGQSATYTSETYTGGNLGGTGDYALYFDTFGNSDLQSVKISATGGDAFDLRGLSVATYHSGNLVISSSKGSTVLCSNTCTKENIDLSGNPYFQGVTSFTLDSATTGIFLEIDDLDFEAANTAPSLDTNTGLTVLEGSDGNQLSNTELSASDSEQSASSITYQVTSPVSHGNLFVDGEGGGSVDGTYNGEALVGSGSFTQADIDAGKLLYRHLGSEAASDSFDFDISDGAGGTAAGNTFSISVTNVNDAPTVSGSTVSLSAILEDETDPAGDAVGAFVSGSDAEGDTLGIAITGVQTADGTWQYSTDSGATWSSVGAVSDASALLLDDTARLRFVPDSNYDGSASATYRVWDQTSGSNGATGVDVSVNGGTTAYSAGTQSGTVSITAVNDEPTFTATVTDPTFTEGGSAASLYSSAAADTIENGQTFAGFMISVSDIAEPSEEQLLVDGSAVTLTHGNTLTTATNSLGVSVSIVGSTATVSATGGSLSTTAVEALFDNVAYRHTGDTPTTGDRDATIASVRDDGGTANNGDDTVSLSIASTVTVTLDTTAPTADAGSDLTIPQGSWPDLDASASSDDVGIVSYEWAFGNGETATGVTPTNTLWTVGTHTVTLTVTDKAGNSDTDTVSVTVEQANANYHGGPDNLGYYPNQNGPLRQPVEAWSITDGTPQVMQPTIVDGTLYTAFHDGGQLYALDPATGAEIWSATPGGSSGSTWTTPAYANGVLYLGSNDYKLHAIDASTGAEIWSYSTQTNVRSAPAVVDGVVYFGSNDGNMTAINATTGEELWFHTLHQPVIVESNPAVVDGVVYFGADDDNVTALNATDGSLVWRYGLPDESQSDPTVAQNTVYIGSDSVMGETSGTGQVFALNATDGTKRWNYSMPGDVDGGLVYADGTVYAGSRGGNLTALNATDGTEEWTVTDSDFRGAPVVAGNVLYISDFGNGSVHAFDKDTGTQLWSYASPTTTLYPTPLAWNGYLYYGSGSHFYALEQPAPTISNVAATNPSGQDVQVSFDSDIQLSTISVSISGAETATVAESDFTESGSGPYTYTATYAGSSDGTYTATVDTATDSDGKDGASGESDSVTVDTTPPTAPSTPDLDAASDSGESNTDDVTSDATPTLSGTAEADSTVGVVSDLDGSLGTTTADGTGDWSFTPSSAISEATHSITATATDSAGNTGPASNALEVTIDTTAPAAPSTPDLDAASDTGQSSTDDRTNDDTPTLSGTAEAASTIEVTSSIDGSLGTTTADATGDWSFTPSSAISEGAHSITVTATDAAGNAGPSSTPLSVTVDTTAPSAPSTPDLDAASDTGQSSTDDLTNGDTPMLSGTADTNAAIEIDSDQDGNVGSTTADGSGDWVVTLSTLSEATHTLTATATDAAGNAVQSSGLSVTVDTTAPSVSNYVVSMPSSQGAIVTFDSDERLPGISIAISGAESATLTESDVTESGSGPYTYTAAYAGSSDGTYTATLDSATDAAGNDGASGQSDSTSVDTTPPSVWEFTVTNPADHEVWVSFYADERLDSIALSISGAEEASLSTAAFTERAIGDGTYTYTATYGGSTDGDYTVILSRAADAAGNDHPGSESATVTVAPDTTAPAISGLQLTNPSLRTVEISFDSTERLSTIDLSISGAESATLARDDFAETTNGDGTYTYSATYAGTVDGTYTGTLHTAADAAGNDGASGQSDAVSVQTTIEVTTVAIRPATTLLATGDAETVEIAVLNSSEAVATFDLTLSIPADADGDTVLTALDGPAVDEYTIEADRRTVHVRGSVESATNGTAATVTLVGTSLGTAPLVLTDVSLSTASGDAVDHAVRNGSVTVVAATTRFGDGGQPPENTDGDSLLEDVNGDGELDIFDALTYYNERWSPTIQNNPELFDYDGDGTPGTLFDALALYNELTA